MVILFLCVCESLTAESWTFNPPHSSVENSYLEYVPNKHHLNMQQKNMTKVSLSHTSYCIHKHYVACRIHWNMFVHIRACSWTHTLILMSQRQLTQQQLQDDFVLTENCDMNLQPVCRTEDLWFPGSSYNLQSTRQTSCHCFQSKYHSSVWGEVKLNSQTC